MREGEDGTHTSRSRSRLGGGRWGSGVSLRRVRARPGRACGQESSRQPWLRSWVIGYRLRNHLVVGRLRKQRRIMSHNTDYIYFVCGSESGLSDLAYNLAFRCRRCPGPPPFSICLLLSRPTDGFEFRRFLGASN